MKCKLSVMLLKINRDRILEKEFNFDQILTTRQDKFKILTRTRFKIGGHIPNRRLELPYYIRFVYIGEIIEIIFSDLN